jgi:hypothetical protein
MAEMFLTICIGVTRNPHGMPHHPRRRLESNARVCAFDPHSLHTTLGMVFQDVRYTADQTE